MKSKNEIQSDYQKRSNYAALKKYMAKAVSITIRLHPEKDADIIASLDRSKPLGTQVKERLRKSI